MKAPRSSHSVYISTFQLLVKSYMCAQINIIAVCSIKYEKINKSNLQQL